MLSAGEAQQALINGVPSNPQNQNSWLFNALTVQQQQQPPRDQQPLFTNFPASSEQGGVTIPAQGYQMPANAHMYQSPASFLIQRMQHVQGHPAPNQKP